jgi:hypothetical protein
MNMNTNHIESIMSPVLEMFATKLPSGKAGVSVVNHVKTNHGIQYTLYFRVYSVNGEDDIKADFAEVHIKEEANKITIIDSSNTRWTVNNYNDMVDIIMIII